MSKGRNGAQGCGGFHVPARYGSQAQYLLSGTRPQRDAIRARGRMQRRERVIGIDVDQAEDGSLLGFDGPLFD